MNTVHGHGHAPVGGQGHSHGHADEHPHGQSHGQGQQPPHKRTEAPTTAGRLIRYARVYDLIVWAMSLGWGRALRKLPLDIAGIRRGEQVLDVGCGTGDLTLAAAKRVGSGGMVYGIDPSPEMIEVARRKAGRKGYAAQFQLEAVESLSFPDGAFDVVLSSLMMHHLPGDLQRRALAEIRRVLRPGGRILIVDWDWQAATKPPRLWEPGGIAANRHGQHTHTSHAPKGKPQPGGATLGALLRNADFTAVESGPLRYDWLAYALGRMPE